MERSVSRAELCDDYAPSSPESIVIDKQDFEFVQPEQQVIDEVEDELSFRLFAPSKDVKEQTIRLRSLTPEVKEAGFVVPRRDSSYYFAQDGLQGVSAVEIHQLANIKWTGMSYDWRVLRPPAILARSAKPLWSGPVEESSKRRRPGKKTRIKLRVKVSAAKLEAAEAKAARETADLASRENQSRKNREKKLKQRQRAKAKKASAAAETNAINAAISTHDDPT